MDVNSAFNSGLQALHRAEHGLQRNAVTIARHTAHVEGAEDINAAVVESISHRQLAAVGAKVVTAADETAGTLVDLKV